MANDRKHARIVAKHFSRGLPLFGVRLIVDDRRLDLSPKHTADCVLFLDCEIDPLAHLDAEGGQRTRDYNADVLAGKVSCCGRRRRQSQPKIAENLSIITSN
jgi:hypothetical protein